MQPWLYDVLKPTARGRGLCERGVFDFGGEELWSVEDLKMLDDEHWIARNWDSEWEHILSHPFRKDLCLSLLGGGEPIVELAAGPGGGNLSPMLHLAPHTKVVLNDIDSRLLWRWKEFLRNVAPTADVAAVAFDACDMPFLNGSIAGLSSRGGISSCRGDSKLVLRECARVLKPEGRLLLYELCLTHQTVIDLPQALRDLWVYNNWLFGDWQAMLEDAGFIIVSDVVSEMRTLHADESALAYDASLFEIVLSIEYRAVEAKLP